MSRVNIIELRRLYKVYDDYFSQKSRTMSKQIGLMFLLICAFSPLLMAQYINPDHTVDVPKIYQELEVAVYGTPKFKLKQDEVVSSIKKYYEANYTVLTLSLIHI